MTLPKVELFLDTNNNHIYGYEDKSIIKEAFS